MSAIPEPLSSTIGERVTSQHLRIAESPAGFAVQLSLALRDAQALHPGSSVRELAAKIIETLPVETYLGALGVTLPLWVDAELWRQRSRERSRETPPAAPPAAPPSTPSRVRSWYQQQLESQLVVNGKLKYLAYCTANDLHTVASEWFAQATKAEALGARWTTVACYMEDHRLRQAGDISEDELKKLMGAA